MIAFSIRSSTIRLGIFISTLVIAAIIIFQLIWLKRVYRFEQKEFDHSVVKAIRGMYEDINASNYNYSHLNELIENPEPHLYLARIQLPVNFDTLASYLQYELDDFAVFTDCYLGVYSAREGRFIYTRLLRSALTRTDRQITIPEVGRNFDHLALYFPNRRQYIIVQMNFWIISSLLLLVVLLLFGASLYYFYRQKFLNETQKDFIHNFTHEFKTPVSVIRLAAEVLNNPGIAQNPERLATYAAIVDYQSAYLQAQTEKLLHFAYTDSGHIHFSREEVNMHDLVKAAVNNLAPLVTEKKALISIEASAIQPVIKANRDYMFIVIVNLVDNAIKYSKEPRVTIRTMNTARHFLLSVADNGIGIAKEDRKRLFRKFFRVHKEDTYATRGFGIGLSFVKTIVRAHGGTIHVESEPGRGSVFTIELPYT